MGVDDQPLDFDPTILLRLAEYRMPFGKYADRLLIDLPEPYVVWFANEGFPRGELGDMLRITHEIKVNGLEYLFEPLRNIKNSSSPDIAPDRLISDDNQYRSNTDE